MLVQERLEAIFDREFRDEGENFSSLCPLHNERRPSFFIHKEDMIYHCFGCKAAGRLINLVKDYRGVEEKEATKLLGMSGEELIWAEFNAILPEKTEPKIYPESWLAPYERKMHKYVLNRGFTETTLSAAGALYDHHRKRQVFPHRNREGQLVGAIGRACRAQNPKWHYYWKYQKGASLYTVSGGQGSMARGSVHSTWIVEGVFDALWLYQHGIQAAAILGSKASDRQIQEIKDNYDTVVIAMDNDEAGLAGARDLYTRLKGSVKTLGPVWPKWGIDIMDTDPTKLPIYNFVEHELIKAGCSEESYTSIK